MLFEAIWLLMLNQATIQGSISTISNSLDTGQTYESFAEDISMVPDGDTINIYFEVINQVMTSTFLKVSTEEAVRKSSTKVNSYYEEDPFDHDDVDLDAMWEFREQYINVEKQAGEDTLYMGVFNFDPTYRYTQPINFTITIGFSDDQDCASCGNGEDVEEFCFCDCESGSGKLCSRFVEEVDDSQIYRTISPRSIYYFSIPPTLGSYLHIDIAMETGLGEAYFQFIHFQDQVASYLNVATTSTGSGAVYNLNNGQTVTVEASLSEKSVSLAIANFNTYDVNVELGFTASNGANILVIVLGVLGGLLLLILIVAVVFIVRKSGNVRVMSESQPTFVEVTKLNGEQIERFFPEAYLRELLSPPLNRAEQSSISSLESNAPDNDCVICLEKMQLEHPVRITYCHHIFHSECLMQWFKKQRTCPYCRKQYTRKNTKQEYEKLLKQNDSKVLKNLTLMHAIYYSNPKISVLE